MSTTMDGRLKQISHLCLDMTNKNLLLGTEGGNIYTLNLTSFSIEDSIIYQDIVIQNSTDEFKVNPGAVEALQVHPTDVDKLLIGKSKRFPSPQRCVFPVSFAVYLLLWQ